MYIQAADGLTTDDGKALAKHALKSQSDGRLNAMINQAKHGLATWTHDYDTDPWLLNCPDGTLDLRTGVLRPHVPADRLTKIAGIAYDPDARCPKFLAFLKLFQPDPIMRAFLQRAVGYSLTGITNEQCLFFVYGIGSNGKSTFLNVLQALLGEYGNTASAETFMVKKTDGGINNDVADLVGARAVVSGELEDGKRFAESLIKVMTGSDRIKARFLHKEFFSFAPTFKLWVQGNHKPVIRGTDEGIWRRIRLIPFEVRIKEDAQIKGFSDKLIASELPGMLAWAVAGCRSWQAHGLAVPEPVQTATKNYRSEMDVLASFLEDSCVAASGEEVTKTRLYEVYHQWAKGGEEFLMSKSMFSRRMQERGIEEHRGNSARVWLNIKIRQDF
jgi:putative DNA primase/helicase